MLWSTRALRCLALACLVTLAPQPARADCAPGRLSYDDIDTVVVEANGCGRPLIQRASSLSCSEHWAFWNANEGLYTRLDESVSRGDYLLAVSLASIRVLLKRDDFFELIPGAVVTDRRQTAVTVLRCGIVTRLLVYRDAAPANVRKLLSDLDAVIATSGKHMLNPIPTEFPYSGIFDAR